MGHTCANIWKKLSDMILHIAPRQGLQELQKLRPNTGRSIEDEGKQRGQNDADWLWERRIHWPGGDRSRKICERVTALAVGFGGEEREVVCELGI
jgi:hypothetical protein